MTERKLKRIRARFRWRRHLFEKAFSISKKILVFAVVLGFIEIILLGRVILALLVLASWLVLLAIAYRLISPSRIERDFVANLASYEDEAHVGILAESLEFGDLRIYNIASAALIKLLPRLSASSFGMLHDYQVECLCHNLGSVNPRLGLVILQCFAHVGDARVLPWLRQLANNKPPNYKWYNRSGRSLALTPRWKSDDRLELSQCALLALKEIERRQMFLNDQAGLVRPASVSTTSLGHLLRIPTIDDNRDLNK
jgi:hypothetical protein